MSFPSDSGAPSQNDFRELANLHKKISDIYENLLANDTGILKRKNELLDRLGEGLEDL